MDIPEIRLLVARHLGAPHLESTRHALVSCVRVCRDWHETFIPFLYSEFDSDRFSADISGLDIGLNRHGHCVTELSVTFPHPLLDTFATTTSNIKGLSIYESNQGTFGRQHRVRTLLSNNSGIERLYLTKFSGANLSITIKEIIRCCPKLKGLQLDGWSFDVADLECLHGFSNISKLRFSDCNVVASGRPLTRTPLLSGLKHLDMYDIPDCAIPAMVEMTMNWSRLETLFLGCFLDNEDSSSQSRDALQRFQPSPQLLNLRLSGVDLTAQDLARVLDGCPVLTDLFLCTMHVGEASFISLINLAGTLTRLHFSHPRDKGYWRTHQLLCSLPKLVEFRCTVMDVDEMHFNATLERAHHFSATRRRQYGERIQREIGDETEVRQATEHLLGQWTCSGLQQLEIDELILSLDVDRNKAFADQLGNLRHITTFCVDDISRRVLSTLASNFTRSAMAAVELPNMQGAVKVSHTDRYQDISSLMGDPKLHWVTALWPEISQYTGPYQILTEQLSSPE